MSFLDDCESKCDCGNILEWDIPMCEDCLNPVGTRGKKTKTITDLQGNVINASGNLEKKKQYSKKSKKKIPIVRNYMIHDLEKVSTLADLKCFVPSETGTIVPKSFWKLWRKHKDKIKEMFFLKKNEEGVFFIYCMAKTRKKPKKHSKQKNSLTGYI